MNNLENLLANDKPELLYIMGYSNSGISCGDCMAHDFCFGAGSDIDGCAETRATWLLQECVKADSWDQIEADKQKETEEYWRCNGFNCNSCPSVFSDGKTPKDHYGVDWCAEAKWLDLIARCKQLALEGAF